MPKREQLMILTFRGTGEPRLSGGEPAGMLSFITNPLPREHFLPHEVSWSANIGPFGGSVNGADLNYTVQEGVEAGLRQARHWGGPIGILGYSLGGIVGSRLYERMMSLPEDIDLRFVMGIANPLRRRDDYVRVPGHFIRNDVFGIHGELRQHGQWSVPVYEYANPKDVITCCSSDSFLRHVNNGISQFSFRDGIQVEKVYAALQRWVDSRFTTQWWDAAYWLNAKESWEGLAQYLLPAPHGAHVGYHHHKMGYTGLTYLEHARQTILNNYLVN